MWWLLGQGGKDRLNDGRHLTRAGMTDISPSIGLRLFLSFSLCAWPVARVWMTSPVASRKYFYQFLKYRPCVPLHLAHLWWPVSRAKVIDSRVLSNILERRMKKKRGKRRLMKIFIFYLNISSTKLEIQIIFSIGRSTAGWRRLLRIDFVSFHRRRQMQFLKYSHN